ncbi:hypothetical protein WJX73_008218 [Symbiochloris irregularis]|uniref:Uncharacterized protein n=1 Tax=Symbiochloris irregularis TaxID=706552 RepID=A0AAW1NT28_9CHLO
MRRTPRSSRRRITFNSQLTTHTPIPSPFSTKSTLTTTQRNEKEVMEQQGTDLSSNKKRKRQLSEAVERKDDAQRLKQYLQSQLASKQRELQRLQDSAAAKQQEVQELQVSVAAAQRLQDSAAAKQQEVKELKASHKVELKAVRQKSRKAQEENGDAERRPDIALRAADKEAVAEGALAEDAEEGDEPGEEQSASPTSWRDLGDVELNFISDPQQASLGEWKDLGDRTLNWRYA